MLGLVPRDHWEHKFSDFFQSLMGILGPEKRNKTINIPGLGKCIPVRSGRAGLVAAIRALDLPKGARIAVPLYCCPVVFEAITVAGSVPRFIDIESESFCMSPEDLSAKMSGLDAIIAVHMFGNMCDVTKLKTVAHSIPIIEDCAQALGSKRNGRLAGSFGDIAFFSFRSGKYLSVGEGGALFSHHEDVLCRINEIIANMPNPNLKDELMHVLKSYIKSILRSKPLYGLLGYQLWSIASNKLNLVESSNCSLSQIYSSDLNTANTRFPLLDTFIERQRANADFYSEALKLEPGMICIEKPGTFYNRYLYAITFPSTIQRDYIASYLLDSNIDTMKYLDNVVQIATKSYGYGGDCPVAQGLSKQVLIIPNYYSLKNHDIQHIAESLNAGWAKIRKL